MPAPMSVQATTSEELSTATRASSRSAAVHLAPADVRCRTYSSTRCSSEMDRSVSLMASRGPMRTTVGCHGEPSAACKPSLSTREIISSTAQLLGAATRRRGTRRLFPLSAPQLTSAGAEPTTPFADLLAPMCSIPTVDGRGMSIFAVRFRVAKIAESMATMTRVFPVPGGPWSKRKPSPGAQQVCTACSCTLLSCAANTSFRPSERLSSAVEAPADVPFGFLLVTQSALLGERPICRAFDCAIARSNGDRSTSACERRQLSIQRGQALCSRREACIRSAGSSVPQRLICS
mmetsp:Transcript_7085/g.21794  ORF Transcript_7085/g.21794 Transcript_7085/m.21794 type:complete len:291 (-) Transcript_7085:590-1462(-)